ncbi:MAG: protoporphyrinogen oxidase [Actinobacteria bacterium]|nr:protoporphyrinogen oxidase [Actinomycetota bacterium]
MKNVIVVGGGLGGLFTAVELRRRGMDVTVLEATSEPGGVARTVIEDGFVLEPAASSVLLPNPELSPILETAGVEMVPAAEAAKNRYVYTRGRLIEIPESPALLLAPLVSWKAKLRAVREPWVKTPPPDGDESMHGFFERRFGPELGALASTLMAHGVFAGDPSRLSMRGAFPKMVALEDEAGSMIRGGIARMRQRPKGRPRASVHVAAEGMAGVARTLAAHLGGAYRSEWPVTSIERDDGGWTVHGPGEERADTVIVAVPPHAAARLLPSEVSGIVAEGTTAPVVVVWIAGRTADVPVPSGFGVLIGPDANVHALGILFESRYAPGRAPSLHTLAKGIYGGAADPAVMERSDEDLVALFIEETGRVCGVEMKPSWTRVIRQEPGIPQYDVGHVAWLDKLDTALSGLPGLHVAGWGYRGIGLSGLAADAVRLGAVLSGE